MIDHVLGRPSVQFRKIQVFAVVSFWSLYLFRGNKHGPPGLNKLSNALTSRLTAWQQLVVTLLWLYVARNFGKLVGLECPEPLANLYSRSYFRATWVTTALDAGFWSAMRIRRKWIRDIASMVFSVYYLIAAEQADDKVRKVRSTLSVEHLRVSWNKGTTPYLDAFTKLRRPRFTRYPPRAIRIARPPESSYQEPVTGWLYFDGPLSALQKHTNVMLDIPGGGFVAMSPRTNDDKLLAWAGKTGLPVLSLDYRKAPEYPYPYALNECYDVYHTLVASRGRCIGLSGETDPKIVITGDSAGGNLAAAVVLMILQSGGTDSRKWQGEETLPPPEGLVLVYPALDMNIGNWMTDEQMSLIKDKRMRKTNKAILRRKSEDYSKLTPGTPHHSEDEDDVVSPPNQNQNGTVTGEPVSSSPLSSEPVPSATHVNSAHVASQTANVANSKPKVLKTRLAMSSMISYFNDRILTPEMMRAMIILYVGPHHRPDFSTDFLLCPLLAPESLLANFPKTYFLTGERDPLVDDTVIFAGRIRQAKYARWIEQKELGVLAGREKRSFEERDHVEVSLIPGISHGFLSFASVFPDAWRYIFRCARWAEEIFARADARALDPDAHNRPLTPGSGAHARHHRRLRTESSGEEDNPLEMSIGSSSSPSGKIASSPGRRAVSDKAAAGGGAGTKAPRRGPMVRMDSDQRGWEAGKRNMSSVSLASEEDLVGRRMRGFTGGLMGMTGEEGGVEGGG
ncbi:MAG: hypothetical protein M1833_006724 [Piccolia ochrophora]|nr:MAG: hypothetical protein M1833_006724 [Piccolia ochrophora]